MNKAIRVQRMSRLVFRLGMIVGFVSTSIAGLRWFVIDDPNWLPPTIATYINPELLSQSQRIAGFVIELLPLSAALFTLFSLHRICNAYCKGDLFGQTFGKNYRRFGSGLIFLGIANGLYTSLILAIFSLLEKIPKLVLAIGFSTADLYLIIVGLAVFMLGSVMDEAHRINVENEQFI